MDVGVLDVIHYALDVIHVVLLGEGKVYHRVPNLACFPRYEFILAFIGLDG